MAARFAGAAEEHLRVLEAVDRAVRAHFYDPTLGGLDWDAIVRAYRPKVEAARSDAEARSLLLDLLGRLHASHTTILDAEVYRATMAELFGREHLTCGVLLEESLPGRVFVRALYEGGPGERAGLRVGDRVVAVEGDPVLESDAIVDAGYDPAFPGPRLLFLRPDRGPIVLLVQPTEDADSRFETKIVPERTSGVEAARRSVRVIERDGRRVGVVHLWFCQKGVVDVLTEAIRGPFRDVDALVLDVRGRGGFSNVVDRIVAVFHGRRGLLDRLRSRPGTPPLWTRPMVLLVDGRTRSAKEVLAARVRELGLGEIVGQRTEGAVLGAFFLALPDGSWLELAGSGFTVAGRRLEGVGVAPDHEVDFVVPYARGRDPILEKGIEVAVRAAANRRRARSF